MKLVDLIPNPDALLALEPDELGLRILPVLAGWRNPGNSCNLAASSLDCWEHPQLGGIPENTRPIVGMKLVGAYERHGFGSKARLYSSCS